MSQGPPLVPLHAAHDLHALRRDFSQICARNLDAAASTLSASRLATVSEPPPRRAPRGRGRCRGCSSFVSCPAQHFQNQSGAGIWPGVAGGG